MKSKKRNFLWNGIIVLALVLCLSAFVLHYKNWTKIEGVAFSVYSGIYSEEIAVTDIHAMDWVPKLPQMERKNGFSWLAKEKGIFKDSVTGSKVYVFVDDLKQRKLRLTYKDSLLLYFNSADSLETLQIFDRLSMKLDSIKDIQN